MKFARPVVLLTAVAVAALLLAACGTPNVANAPTHKTTPNYNQAPAGSPASQQAAPTPSPTPNSGPSALNSPLTMTNVSGAKFQLTINQVDQSAQGANPFMTPDAGNHFVAVEETFVGVFSTYQDDVDVDTSLIGTNNQTYQPTFDPTADGTNFNSGQVTLTEGQTLVGWVNFQVPDGVNVQTVVYSPSAGFGGDTGRWQIG